MPAEQYPIKGALATADYSQTIEARARSLGLPVRRVVSLMNVGFGEPPVDDSPMDKYAKNPNRHLFRPNERSGWYMSWSVGGRRSFIKLSHDLDEARRMRDEKLAELNYKFKGGAR